jgi:small subunit ribosomal protein S16
MALRIRLRRMGRKKAPHYRIVVAENTMPRDGRFVDRIGFYNPRTDPMTLEVDLEAARSWIARGATPTDTVRSLLRRAGINKPAGEVEEAQPVATTAAEPEAEEAPAEETPTEATPAEELRWLRPRPRPRSRRRLRGRRRRLEKEKAAS